MSFPSRRGREGTDTRSKTDGKASAHQADRVPGNEGNAGLIPICTWVHAQHGSGDTRVTEGKWVDSGLGDTDRMHSALWRKSKMKRTVTRRLSTTPHAEGAGA